MELTLRNARKLEQKIDGYLTYDEFRGSKAIRVLDDIETIENTLREEKDKGDAQITLRDELLQLRFLIRRAIQETNEKAGINSAITTREYLYKKLGMFESYRRMVRKEEWPAVVDDIAMMKQRFENPSLDSYSTPKSTKEMSVFDSVDDDEFKKVIKDVKNQISAIDDNILVLNNTNKVTLTEDHVAVLEKADLV